MRRVIRIVAAMLMLAAPLAPRAAHSLPADALPNLVPFPPLDVHLDITDDPSEGTTAIRFTTQAANRGTVPLEVFGAPDGPDTSRAFQCIHWVSRACTARQEIGGFVWSVVHMHYHFNDFARYELRRLTPEGAPDMSPDALIRTSGKVSFCLMDSSPDAGSPVGDTVGWYPVYQECNPVLQGITVGWEDDYTWRLAGQEIPTRGIADGSYALVMSINPARHLLESNYDDDVSFERVTLSDAGATLTVG